MEIPSTNSVPRISVSAAPGARVIELVIKIPAWLEKPVVLPLLWYRRLRYGYAFRRIRLSQGRYAIVDPDDYPRLSRYKWYTAKGGHSLHAMRGQWSGKLKKRLTIMMHREIMDVSAWPQRGRRDGLVVDHINHNGLDNRKANLRICTQADNTRNARYPKINTSSRYRGVWYNGKKKKWRAMISINNKKKQLGYYSDELAAAQAYDNAARKFHGDFAVLNFPKSAADAVLN